MDNSFVLVLTLALAFVIGGGLGAVIAYLYAKATELRPLRWTSTLRYTGHRKEIIPCLVPDVLFPRYATPWSQLPRDSALRMAFALRPIRETWPGTRPRRPAHAAARAGKRRGPSGHAAL